MPQFLFDLPQADLALYVVAATVGLTWLGILFVKPLLRLLLGGAADINESISFVTSIFSLFYGLLVGLLAVAAYQNLDEVERSAFREATSLATLYADMESYPEPFSSEMQALLRDYTLYAIHKEWPAHREGRILIGGAHRADAMRQRLAQFAPGTVSQEILHREAVGTFHRFVEARQARLAGTITRIPAVLWYAVIAGAAVNIILLVLARMKPLRHLILGGLASFFLGVMLFVIIALDDPLRGESGVGPDALQSLWETRMVFDEPLV